MKKPKKKVTTQKEFEFFGRRVMYWQEQLNLLDWRIDIYTGDVNSSADAGVNIDFPGRCAAVILSEYPPNNSSWTKKSLDRAAFHEVAEILLARLAFFGSLTIRKAEVDEAVHEVIRTLENSIVPKCRGEM